MTEPSEKEIDNIAESLHSFSYDHLERELSSERMAKWHLSKVAHLEARIGELGIRNEKLFNALTFLELVVSDVVTYWKREGLIPSQTVLGKDIFPYLDRALSKSRIALSPGEKDAHGK